MTRSGSPATAIAPIRLSDLVGRPVQHPDGSRAGRVADVELELGEESPRVRALQLRTGRRTTGSVPWESVAAVAHDRVVLADAPVAEPAAEGPLLARDVLDAQIVDLAGRRVVRVGDVLLGDDGGGLEVLGVEIGGAPVLRRLGLRRLAGRRHGEAIAWHDLHLVASRGAQLRLRVPRSELHAMTPEELAGVLARLPLPGAAHVLQDVHPAVAARAVEAGHPRAAAAMVQAMDSHAAGAVVEAMRADDAVAALRHVRDDTLARVLGGVSTARAQELRRLLAYSPDTAGGLMTVDHRTARAGEPAAAILAGLAARPPAVDGLLTVFVVDDEEQLVGTVPPRRLVAGRAEAQPVTALSLDTPVAEVVRAFAVQDVLALPVVDGDRRVVGAVAVDDVLEELLVERLPGRRRLPFRRPRRRAHR